MSQNWFPLNHPITENRKGDYRRPRWPSLYQFISHQEFSFLGEFSPASSQGREQGSENPPTAVLEKALHSENTGCVCFRDKTSGSKATGYGSDLPHTHLGRGILLCGWLKEPFSVQCCVVGVEQVQSSESAHLVKDHGSASEPRAASPCQTSVS